MQQVINGKHGTRVDKKRSQGDNRKRKVETVFGIAKQDWMALWEYGRYVLAYKKNCIKETAFKALGEIEETEFEL